MAKKYITIGGILSLIGALALLFWIMDFSSDLINNPTDEKNIEKVVNKTIDEAEITYKSVVARPKAKWRARMEQKATS